MTLTDIYTTILADQTAAEREAVATSLATTQAQVVAATRLLRQYLAKWEPLRSLLGIKGWPVLTGGEMVLHGQTSINNLPVDTTASVELPRDAAHQPNFRISISSRLLPDVTNRLEITSHLDAYHYPERLGLLCTIWMEHYQSALTELAVDEGRARERAQWTTQP